MVELINDKVVILPQAKHFFKGIKDKELEPLIEYLYHYFNEESIYANVLPSERHSLVVSLLSKSYSKFDIEAHKEKIKEFENITLTPTKRLALSLGRRIDRIIELLDNADILIDDLEKEGKNMKALTEIFKLQDTLAEKLAKESGVKKAKGSKEVSVYEETKFDDV